MIVVFAIDALEFNLVEKFKCTNLKQDFYGKTDISEFSQPRTMVLWSSFMTGKNKESEIVGTDGREVNWNYRIDMEQTFFSNFQNPSIFDLPGYSYDLKVHEESRKLLKEFFQTDDKEKKETIRKRYNKDAFSHHRWIKEAFFNALKSGSHDFILGYFSLGDVIGHLNFGNRLMMKTIYREFNEMVDKIKEIVPDAKLLIISDHGMKGIGMFGDHSNYGFWSTNFKKLENPRIIEFKNTLLEVKNES